jgi:glycosyltransferase involved in cell wall biosynthesis
LFILLARALDYSPSFNFSNRYMKKKQHKKNNILYTTPFAGMVGGGQWSLYYLIKNLNMDIFRPIVLCPAEGELAELMRSAGAEVVCFDMGRIRHLNPFVIKRLISLIKQRKIALVHTDSTTETLYAGIAARVMQIPLIWHIRVSDNAWFLDRILSLLSTRLILVADAIKKRFSWLCGSKKMSVIYNGIDLKEFDSFRIASSIREEFNISQSETLLACIGRLEPGKGQRYLIRAMEKVNHAKLILLGRGDNEYTKKLEKFCKRFNVFDRVIFTGHRTDIPSVLRDIDIVIFPTIKSEGFPRVILETMAAAKPVIATDVGGNKEAVINGSTGYIVPPKDSIALGIKIKELMANTKKREQMGNSGRKRVEEMFPIERNIQEIEKLYCEVLRDR